MIGDRSKQTFKGLWLIFKCWHSFFYVTDGWQVYPIFINAGDQIVSKTYMTRVEGENTRLRHHERQTTLENLVLFQSVGDAEVFTSLTAPLFKILDSSPSRLNHYPFSNALTFSLKPDDTAVVAVKNK